MSVAALLKSIEDQLEDLRWDIQRVAPTLRIERAPDEPSQEFARRVHADKNFRSGNFRPLNSGGEPVWMIGDWDDSVVAVETTPLERKVERVLDRVRDYRQRADAEAGFNNHGR